MVERIKLKGNSQKATNNDDIGHVRKSSLIKIQS